MRENGFGWVKGAGPAQGSRRPARANGAGNDTPQHATAGDAVLPPPPEPPEVAPEIAYESSGPQMDWPRLARRLKLSPQQVRIVQLMLDDYTTGEIARTLGVKDRTVTTHIERMCKTLRVRSRLAIIRTVLLEAITMMQEEHARQMQRPPEAAAEATPTPEGEKQDAGGS